MEVFNRIVVSSEPIKLDEYLKALKESEENTCMTGRGVLIKVNGHLISSKKITKTYLNDGDSISIYPLLGGG
ncbi:MAG: MoaD/ThiS family protein [Clostridia bacterium]|nr:MoaD/ThiS family protein [Clostridia bacterium]